jgi:hypothetical protein
MSEPYYTKDPDSKLDYQFDWSTYLGVDTIATSAWIVPSGITKVNDTNDDTTTTIWLSGGTANTEYEVTNRITTATGRIVDRSMTILVKER